MSVCRKEWKVIILVEGSHKGDGTVFEVLNIEDNVVCRTEASG